MFSRNRKRLHILNLKGILRTHDPHADAVVFIDGVRDFFCNLFYFVSQQTVQLHSLPGLAVKDIFLFRRKVRLWNKNALRGIALRRKGRCRLRGPPQAESFASETLFYIQYNKNR